jgi:hypothetical protein
MTRAALSKQGDVAWRKVVASRDVDITERGDAAAPMAFVFKEEMQKTPHYLRYDHAAGALFLRHAKANLIEARNEKFEYDWDYPTYSMSKRTEDKFHEIFGEGVNYYAAHRPEFDGLHKVNEVDIVAADRLLGECMSDFIAVDGWLWKKVPEPVFHLYRTNKGWKTTLSFDPDPRLGSDRRHFHFGLHQYEEMLDWKARLSEMTNRHGTVDEFTAMDVYEASIDGYAIDLEFALVDLVNHFSETSRSIRPGQGGILSLPEMPLPILDAFCRARRILEIPRGERDDAILAEAIDLLEAVPGLVEDHPEYGVLFAKPSENAFQIEKWHARPISLVPVLDQRRTP